MTVPEQPAVEWNGFSWLRYSIGDLQSEEAVQAEADFRFDKLRGLVDEGTWVADTSANVVPVGMSDRDKAVVAKFFKFCIIDQIPPVEEGRVVPGAWGSVISGNTIIHNGATSTTIYI